MSDGVQPTLAELVALRELVQRRRAVPRGRHGVHGPAPSPLRGRGMEYAESREYSAGDDARHIDWRLTARTGRAHTKLFQAERERLTLVVADTSAALYFGTRVRFKSVQAARAGAVAAWAGVRDGDRIAALRGTHDEPPVTPMAGPRGALRVLSALARWYAAPPAGDAGLALALEQATRLLRPGSRVVVLADAGSLAGVADTRWLALGRQHEVALVLLTDAFEQAPPAELLEFSAQGVHLRLDLGDAGQRQRWNGRFVAPLEQASARLPSRGIRVHALATDAPSDAWLQLLQRPRIEVA